MRAKTPEVSRLTVNGHFFLSLFIHILRGGGGVGGWQLARDVTWNTATTWRWRRSYFGRESGSAEEGEHRNPEGWSCNDKFCFV